VGERKVSEKVGERLLRNGGDGWSGWAVGEGCWRLGVGEQKVSEKVGERLLRNGGDGWSGWAVGGG
jgi:hypothetical protein